MDFSIKLRINRMRCAYAVSVPTTGLDSLDLYGVVGVPRDRKKTYLVRRRTNLTNLARCWDCAGTARVKKVKEVYFIFPVGIGTRTQDLQNASHLTRTRLAIFIPTSSGMDISEAAKVYRQ